MSKNLAPLTAEPWHDIGTLMAMDENELTAVFVDAVERRNAHASQRDVWCVRASQASRIIEQREYAALRYADTHASREAGLIYRPGNAA